jgi:hypothetical protein
MADEIRISQTLRYAKSSSSASHATSFSVTQSGDKYQAGVQIVGTTEESLDKGDIGTIAFVAFKNLDSTNFVQMGITTGVYTIKCLAGAGGVIPWNSSTAPLVKANTAPVEVDYLMVEA